MTAVSEKLLPTLTVEKLRRTADYRAMRGGRRHHAGTFMLQTRRRPEGGEVARFGLTVTKRIGNAVERNRIKRRLREALRACAAGRALGGFDYVLVARREALDRSFGEIVGQLAEALDRTARLEANPRQPGSQGGGRDHRDDRGPGKARARRRDGAAEAHREG